MPAKVEKRLIVSLPCLNSLDKENSIRKISQLIKGVPDKNVITLFDTDVLFSVCYCDYKMTFNGLDKKQSTEFSFLLAVPTMFAATGYDLLKTPIIFSKQEIVLLCVGLVIAFITTLIAVKIFLKIVENYGFKFFGYYRIIIGIVFLILMK